MSNEGAPPWVPFGCKIVSGNQDKSFKSLEKSKDTNAESEFDQQRKDAIAEASTGAVKKTFGGRVKQNVQPTTQNYQQYNRGNRYFALKLGLLSFLLRLQVGRMIVEIMRGLVEKENSGLETTTASKNYRNPLKRCPYSRFWKTNYPLPNRKSPQRHRRPVTKTTVKPITKKTPEFNKSQVIGRSTKNLSLIIKQLRKSLAIKLIVPQYLQSLSQPVPPPLRIYLRKASPIVATPTKLIVSVLNTLPIVVGKRIVLGTVFLSAFKICHVITLYLVLEVISKGIQRTKA